MNKKTEKMIVLLFIETISDLKRKTVDHKNVTIPVNRMTYQRSDLSICQQADTHPNIFLFSLALLYTYRSIVCEGQQIGLARYL